MKYVIFDIECTTSNTGNPFDLNNKMICAGGKYNSCDPLISYYDDEERYKNTILGYFNSVDRIVGFNLKFDLNWIRREWGYDYSNLRIWDCQLAEFLLSYQEAKYPSLDDTLAKYGFPLKLDVVKTEYWEKGINTDKIPREILTEYLARDLEATEQVFKKQYELFQTDQYKHLYPLFKLQCQDLLVLADMEYNGIFFNTEKARRHANEIQTKQNEIIAKITEYVGNVPFSLTSDAHLSAILYGGIILEEYRFPIGVYASGEKKGQPRYKVGYKTYEFPQLIVPLKGTQVKENLSKKEESLIERGILKEQRLQYKVDETTLKQVKAKGTGKILLESIMEFNKLDKLRSTYLEGWSNIIDKMHWEPNILHSNLNQTFVVTGRLSSSNPNGQNADKATKKYCESRYV